jgi:peptidoglycan/xylan/chitin deacetylase (PgdA/CDA1 family)
MVAVVADALDEGLAVEVTFDDGNASDVEVALPALLERGVPATFHVCAGRIGLPGYLDESALRDVQAAGMAIGSHGWSHVDLTSLSEADLIRETRDSQHRLSDACGARVTRFAVPMGRYDRRVLHHLRHYATVYTSDATRAARGAWLVPRWSYVRTWTPAEARALTRTGGSHRRAVRQRMGMMVKRWR